LKHNNLYIFTYLDKYQLPSFYWYFCCFIYLKFYLSFISSIC